MTKPRHNAEKATGNIAEQAQELLSQTADAASEKVKEAQKQVGAGLERGQEIYEEVRDGVVEQAEVMDKFVRKNPYAAIGISLGLGILFGLYLRRGD